MQGAVILDVALDFFASFCRGWGTNKLPPSTLIVRDVSSHIFLDFRSRHRIFYLEHLSLRFSLLLVFAVALADSGHSTLAILFHNYVFLGKIFAKVLLVE